MIKKKVIKRKEEKYWWGFEVFWFCLFVVFLSWMNTVYWVSDHELALFMIEKVMQLLLYLSFQ